MLGLRYAYATEAILLDWESCKEIRVTGLLNIFPFLGASLDDGGELAFNI